MLHNVFLKFFFYKYLEPNEHIVYVGHKHALLLAKPLFIWFLFGVLTPLYLYFSNTELIWTSVVLAAVFGFWLYMKFLIWFFDCWVITNHAVIDVYWNSIFSRQLVRISFGHFEGISIKIHGFWNTVLRKGNIQIVKIVDNNEVALYDAYHPQKIEGSILYGKQLMLEESTKAPSKHEDLVKELLSEMIAKHAENKGIDLRNIK